MAKNFMRFFMVVVLGLVYLGTGSVGCEFDGTGLGENGPGGDNADGTDAPPPPENMVQVCIERPAGDFAAALKSNPVKLPARWVKVTWTEDNNLLASGRTDEEGYYRQEGPNSLIEDSHLCANFPKNKKFSTQIEYAAPAPVGNKITYKVPFEFSTTEKGQTFEVSALTERLLKNPTVKDGQPVYEDNDIALTGLTFPLIATHDFTQNPPQAISRVTFDGIKKALVYRANTIANDEGGLGKSFLAIGNIKPDYKDGGGVLVLDSIQIFYDYASNGLTSMDPTIDVLFGLQEGLDKTYSHLNIYVGKSADFNAGLCSDPKALDEVQMGMERYSTLEAEFRNTINEKGGVLAGTLPGYFWAGEQKLALQANTTSADSTSTQAIGATYFSALPLWDYDLSADGGDIQLNILVTENDDNYFNDLVACFENVKISPLKGKPEESLTVGNKAFLTNYGTFNIFGKETFKLTLKYTPQIIVK